MDHLTPNEKHYNHHLNVYLDDVLKTIMPVEMVNLITSFSNIRPTRYVPIPGHEDDVVAAFVHRHIYSSDDLPWIVLVPKLTKLALDNLVILDYIFVFQPFVADWDRHSGGKLAYTIQKYVEQNNFGVLDSEDVKLGHGSIGSMIRCPLTRLEFPFPIHTAAMRTTNGSLLFLNYEEVIREQSIRQRYWGIDD